MLQHEQGLMLVVAAAPISAFLPPPSLLAFWADGEVWQSVFNSSPCANYSHELHRQLLLMRNMMLGVRHALDNQEASGSGGQQM